LACFPNEWHLREDGGTFQLQKVHLTSLQETPSLALEEGRRSDCLRQRKGDGNKHEKGGVGKTEEVPDDPLSWFGGSYKARRQMMATQKFFSRSLQDVVRIASNQYGIQQLMAEYEALKMEKQGLLAAS